MDRDRARFHALEYHAAMELVARSFVPDVRRVASGHATRAYGEWMNACGLLDDADAVGAKELRDRRELAGSIHDPEWMA